MRSKRKISYEVNRSETQAFIKLLLEGSLKVSRIKNSPDKKSSSFIRQSKILTYCPDSPYKKEMNTINYKKNPKDMNNRGLSAGNKETINRVSSAGSRRYGQKAVNYFVDQKLLNKLKTKPQNYMFVASLNFSGINLSPFEYNDGSAELNELNKIFVEVLKEYIPDIQQFQIGKIDKDFQEGRLSVWYSQQIQLIDGKLPNLEQFQSLWMKNFVKGTGEKKYKEEHVKNAMMMDFINYLTVVRYVYRGQKFSQIKDLQPTKLLKYLKSKKVNINDALKNKQNKVLQFIKKNKIQVMFLQQATSIGWENTLSNYCVAKNQNSIILFHEKIGLPDEKMYQNYYQSLNFNNDTVCYFSTKNYLLISAHLKAKQENKEQAKDLFQKMDAIQKSYPKLKIIIGIDSNHFLNPTKFNNFCLYPNNEQLPTTSKTRSYMQAQISKANKSVNEVKDHIISNIQIMKGEIKNASDDAITSTMSIPNKSHPYDHYIVEAKLDLNSKFLIKS